MGARIILKWNDAKNFLEQHKVQQKKKRTLDMPRVKGYFKVGKRDYTAFKINEKGKVRLFENLQHEGDCRTKLKLSTVL